MYLCNILFIFAISLIWLLINHFVLGFWSNFIFDYKINCSKICLLNNMFHRKYINAAIFNRLIDHHITNMKKQLHEIRFVECSISYKMCLIFYTCCLFDNLCMWYKCIFISKSDNWFVLVIDILSYLLCKNLFVSIIVFNLIIVYNQFVTEFWIILWLFA